MTDAFVMLFVKHCVATSKHFQICPCVPWAHWQQGMEASGAGDREWGMGSAEQGGTRCSEIQVQCHPYLNIPPPVLGSESHCLRGIIVFNYIQLK